MTNSASHGEFILCDLKENDMHEFGIFGFAGIIGLALLFFLSITTVAAFVFWLWALIDILKNEFTGSNKLIWLLAVISVPFLGMLLYWFIGREQKIRGDDGKL
jgi:Phospholipase_D-nuclease N-terminal